MPSTNRLDQTRGQTPRTGSSVFVVEDHASLRQLIVDFVNSMESLEVIGEAASAEMALDDPVQASADIVLTDLSLPGINGLELTKRLRAENPERIIIVLTAHSDSRMARAALNAGAGAYLVKDNPELIESTVERLLAGERDLVALADSTSDV